VTNAGLAVIGLLVAAAFTPARPKAQSPGPQSANTPAGTALILGRVVDGSTERPMPSVIVTLSTPSASPSRRAITDSSGRFVFHELPAGRYTFSIGNASGALIGGYGVRRPGGATQTFELTDGQRAGDVTLRAWRYGSVAGTVLDQDGEPVVEARVTLLRVEIIAGRRRYRAGPTSMTDDRGMYRISRAEPGEYTAYLPYTQVTLPIDVQGEYDSASSRGQAARQEFERTFGIDSSMGINGSGLRIGDHLLIRSSNLYGADGPIGPSFLSLPPDDSGRVSIYPMTFYPGVAALSEASTFTIDSGQDRVATDIVVRLVPGFRVSGRVTTPEGPAVMVNARLIPQSGVDAADESGLQTATTLTNAAGDFTFLGVPTGSYVLKVVRVPNTARPSTMTSVTVGTMTTFSLVDDSNLAPLPLPDTPTLNASMSVVVSDQDVRSLVVPLQQGPRLFGRLAYDGTATPLTADQLVRVTVTLDPVDGRSFAGATGKGQFDANGQFKTLGLLPGRYMLRLGGNLGPWSLASMAIAARNVADLPFTIETSDIPDVVITLTDHVASLSGAIRDARNNTADPNGVVLVFPSDRSRWTDTGASPRRFRSSRVSTRGTFQIDNLPAGDYLAVAIDDRFSANWQDPQRLDVLARSAARVTVAPGEKKTIDLSTTPVMR
jgi:carboxypeptidase family protein